MSKPSDTLLRTHDSVLLLVDIQDRFRPVVPGIEDVIRKSQALLKAALRLGIPALASEQYPKALGNTVPELKTLLPDESLYFSKLCFSAAGCAPLVEKLNALKRRQVVISGVETHVCVMQTALELASSGYHVAVIADAVSSRNPLDRELALKRMEKHGVELLTTEMAIFEWLRVSGTPEFKELQALIK